MSNYASHVTTKAPRRAKNLPVDQGPGTVSQQEKLPGQKRNNAGGFTFKVSDFDRLDRFLILGSEGGTYYVGERKLTRENAKNIERLIKNEGVKVVDRIVEISEAGRAPKNDPALFVLALCAASGVPEVVKAAFAALPKVARTGTHLFTFAQNADALRGWGKSLKNGVAAWYTNMPVEKLAYQVVKYQQRNGWSHRDVLRLAHPKTDEADRARLFNWITKSNKYPAQEAALPNLVTSFMQVHEANDVAVSVKAIQDFGLTHEMLPTNQLKDTRIWEALLPKMGTTALVRSLGRMGAIGMMSNLSDTAKTVIGKLSDTEAVKKSRIHPIQLLSALKVYSQGRGERGDLTWNVNQRVVDALNDAFYASFDFVPSTGQNYLLGIDCSGSMFGARVQGIPGLDAATVSAVMAMVTMKRESNYWIGGFNHVMSEIAINPNMRLDEVMKVMQRFSWGTTDCALPMITADRLNMTNVDKFVVYTDNETYAGNVQPVMALNRYREKYNVQSKLIVCGTSASQFTIADPNDAGMLDLVGFDSACPQLIAEF